MTHCVSEEVCPTRDAVPSGFVIGPKPTQVIRGGVNKLLGARPATDADYERTGLTDTTPDKNSRLIGGTTACSPTTLPRNSRLATLLLVPEGRFLGENARTGSRKRLFLFAQNTLRRRQAAKLFANLRELRRIDLDESRFVAGALRSKWRKAPKRLIISTAQTARSACNRVPAAAARAFSSFYLVPMLCVGTPCRRHSAS